jgi:hypothetical protein
VGSNPARDTNVYSHFCIVLSCVGKVLAMARSATYGVLIKCLVSEVNSESEQTAKRTTATANTFNSFIVILISGPSSAWRLRAVAGQRTLQMALIRLLVTVGIKSGTF